MDAYNIQIKKDKSYLLIYALLVIAQSILTNTETAPSMPIRLAYWVLAIYPAILRPDWMAGVIAMLYTTSAYGFAYGYMPYENGWYVLFVIAALVVNRNLNKNNRYPVPGVLVAIMLYTGAIELFTSFSMSSISIIVFFVILLLKLNLKEDYIAIERLSIGFAVASSVLSVLYVLFGNRFVVTYENMFDRMGWIDPNYFGMVISLGSITALFEIIRRRYYYSWEKWLYLFTLVASVPVQIMNGSRGAVLAVASSAAVLLLFSRIKMVYKLVIILAGVGFLFFLYSATSIYDFLIYRIDNEDAGGSGRVEIWGIKIRELLQCDIIHIIFGLGSDKGLELGWNQSAVSFTGKMGFHSDYIGYLVKYGVIGFILFLTLLVTPFKKTAIHKKNFPFVLSGMIAVALFAFSLEPYSSGGTAYWLFYMYIFMISINKQYIA